MYSVMIMKGLSGEKKRSKMSQNHPKLPPKLPPLKYPKNPTPKLPPKTKRNGPRPQKPFQKPNPQNETKKISHFPKVQEKQTKEKIPKHPKLFNSPPQAPQNSQPPKQKNPRNTEILSSPETTFIPKLKKNPNDKTPNTSQLSPKI